MNIKLIKYLSDNDIHLDDADIEAIEIICRKHEQHKANVGLCFERTETNPREKAFYESWMDENEPRGWINNGNGILQDLFIESRLGAMTPVKVIEIITPRDRMIVATVIQWLGSNVGIGFLETTFRKFGGSIKY